MGKKARDDDSTEEFKKAVKPWANPQKRRRRR
jgi:hypothetical protein